MLASMASPQGPDPAWTDEQMADDIATISYEQALGTPNQPRLEVSPSHGHRPPAEPPGAPEDAAPHARPPKTASITVRFSAPECARVRSRADEAGLTVSAYLRSCTLEVETLRTQVKDTLAQLRSSKAVSASPSQSKETWTARNIFRGLLEWFRLFRLGRRIAIRVNPANPFAPVQN